MKLIIGPTTFAAVARAIVQHASAGGAGVVEILDGENDKAEVLAVLSLSDPAAATSAEGLKFLNITADLNARARGKARWARVKNGEGDVVLECDITPEGTPKERQGVIEMDDVDIRRGDVVRLNSLVVRLRRALVQ